MSKSTRVQRGEHKDSSAPWQSWSLTARWVLVKVSQAVPTLALVWLAVVLR